MPSSVAVKCRSTHVGTSLWQRRRGGHAAEAGTSDTKKAGIGGKWRHEGGSNRSGTLEAGMGTTGGMEAGIGSDKR